MKKYEIPFTQYGLPYGKRSYTTFLTERKEVYDKAMRLIKKNYSFEVEVLTTGQVSATIVDNEIEQDVAFAITDNVENLVKTEVEKMILTFCVELHRGNEDGN